MKQSQKTKARARQRRYVRVERRLIVARPASDGYSWTLAAALGEMLLMAEEMFGERDHSYTLLGIDFAPDGAKICSPGNCRHIIIHLSMECLTDRQAAYLTLAHEAIHLLSPTGKADANVLEEGLALYFEQWYMNYVFDKGWWNNARKYPDDARAVDAIKQLLALDPDIIQKVRREQPIIAHVTKEQLKAHCPALSDDLATLLCTRFAE